MARTSKKSSRISARLDNPPSGTFRRFHAMSLSLIPVDLPETPRLNGTPIHIPNRDDRLPKFHLVPTHAQVQDDWHARRVFVYLQDTRAEAMEENYKYVSNMVFPEGTAEGVATAGA